jgi:triphosphatase
MARGTGRALTTTAAAARAEDGLELELKLRVAPDDLPALRDHPALVKHQAGEATTRRLVSIYFDTPDRALAKRGISLRVRRIGRRRVQTVKLKDAANGALSSRRELEWRIAEDKPDLARLADLAGELDLPRDSLRRLRPVFTTDITRTEIPLRLDGGTECLAALDRGHVAADSRRIPLSELELELRAGPALPVYRLALALHRDVPMLVSVQSKAELGELLAFGGMPATPKATLPALHAEQTVADAFRSLVQSTLGHWLANQAAALAGDAEGVHQMRIAIRRLRTVFNLFRPYIAPSAEKHVRAELTRFGRVLGEARDWDVFIDETLARAARKPRLRDAAHEVAAAAEVIRERCHQRAAQAIQAPGYTTFILRMSEQLEEQRWLARVEGGHRAPIAAASDPLLKRQARKARRAGRKIARLDAAARHDLRKKLKKLRYSVEFLGSLYVADAVAPYVTRLKRVLDLLGVGNDLAVAQTLMARATAGGHGPAARRLRKRWRRQSAKQLARLPRAWRKFKAAERPTRRDLACLALPAPIG